MCWFYCIGCGFYVIFYGFFWFIKYFVDSSFVYMCSGLDKVFVFVMGFVIRVYDIDGFFCVGFIVFEVVFCDIFMNFFFGLLLFVKNGLFVFCKFVVIVWIKLVLGVCVNIVCSFVVFCLKWFVMEIEIFLNLGWNLKILVMKLFFLVVCIVIFSDWVCVKIIFFCGLRLKWNVVFIVGDEINLVFVDGLV